MAEIEFRHAIREALDEELARDERVVLFGEDVAVAGGVFAVTPGLLEAHGPDRVVDTPISELALAGAAFGSAVTGLRPVIEIMFADFLPLVMDSLVNQATKYWYVSNEQASVPLVIRSACGAGGRFGAIHSQMPVSWLLGVPGLKIVCPPTPRDAKGLLKSAIRDDNPVLFLEHKRLYSIKGEVSDEPIPLGQCSCRARGRRPDHRDGDERRPRRARGGRRPVTPWDRGGGRSTFARSGPSTSTRSLQLRRADQPAARRGGRAGDRRLGGRGGRRVSRSTRSARSTSPGV